MAHYAALLCRSVLFLQEALLNNISTSDKIFIAQIRLKCGKFLLDKWAALLNSYDKSLFAGFVSLGKFDK